MSSNIPDIGSSPNSSTEVEAEMSIVLAQTKQEASQEIFELLQRLKLKAQVYRLKWGNSDEDGDDVSSITGLSDDATVKLCEGVIAVIPDDGLTAGKSESGSSTISTNTFLSHVTTPIATPKLLFANKPGAPKPPSAYKKNTRTYISSPLPRSPEAPESELRKFVVPTIPASARKQRKSMFPKITCLPYVNPISSYPHDHSQKPSAVELARLLETPRRDTKPLQREGAFHEHFLPLVEMSVEKEEKTVKYRKASSLQREGSLFGSLESGFIAGDPLCSKDQDSSLSFSSGSSSPESPSPLAGYMQYNNKKRKHEILGDLSDNGDPELEERPTRRMRLRKSPIEDNDGRKNDSTNESPASSPKALSQPSNTRFGHTISGNRSAIRTPNSEGSRRRSSRLAG